jgi:hypothetical protein
MKRAFFVAALALGAMTPLVAAGEDTAPATAAVGQLAPEIQVTDWINGDGRTSISDFRGEVVFLEFWGTH